MSKALNVINPKTDDLSKINDKGIKVLYQMLREQVNTMPCGCCGELLDYTQEEYEEMIELRDIVKTELGTRGHVPNSVERKKLRQQRAKRGKRYHRD